MVHKIKEPRLAIIIQTKGGYVHFCCKRIVCDSNAALCNDNVA